MSSAVETSNRILSFSCSDSDSRSERAVAIIASPGSRPTTLLNVSASLKVAMPGPHPTSTTLSSLPPVDVWYERTL